MEMKNVLQKIDGYSEEITTLQRELVAIPALSPTYDEKPEHTGEAKKGAFLKTYLERHGFTDITSIEAPDDRVPGGTRPNLIARVRGARSDHTLWVMAHLDIVPPGDLSKWNSDPYALKVDGDVMYGRGVEDNHQGLVAGVMAARALIESKTTPARDLALLFVSDEECGSDYGISYVLEHQNPFKQGDLILVPDGGSPDGSEVEVAEKGIAWLKFKITGTQCHASIPQKGNNALRAGAHLIVALDELQTIFNDEDPIFIPPTSTFEPTKKEANVPNVNTIPGEDIFFLDCRILPSVSIDRVTAEIRKISDRIAAKFNVAVELSFEQRDDAAPATPVDAPVVRRITHSIKEVYGIEAKPIGVGGGTVAAALRRLDLPCVVWSKMDETMHGPNECAKISNIIGDAKVIAHMALSE